MALRDAAPALQFNLMVTEESDHQHKKRSSSSSLAGMASSPRLPPPPPAVSLSLRTRESSAMALKHIFEQIQRNGTGGDASTEGDGSHPASEVPRRRDKTGFQGLHHRSMPDLRSAVSIEQELDLTLHEPVPQHTAVSPSSSLPQPPASFLRNRSSLQTVSSTSSPTKPYSAQLTIFYSGTVNVYSDVPADKAQAIMLLARTGKPCSANCQCHFSSVENLNNSNEATANDVTAWVPTIAVPVSQETLPATAPVTKRSGITPIPVRPVIQSVPSSPSLASASDLPKPQLPSKRPHSGIELPYARKVSLARFLEKRKDRLQMKQANQPAKQETGDTVTENSSVKRDKDLNTVSHVLLQESVKRQCTEAGYAL